MKQLTKTILLTLLLLTSLYPQSSLLLLMDDDVAVPSGYRLFITTDSKTLKTNDNEFFAVREIPREFSELQFSPLESNLLVTTSTGWSNTVVGDPFIVVKDSFYMFYWGWGNRGRTGVATSTDLYNWNLYAGNPILDVGTELEWDAHDAAKPVVILKDGVYYMFYSGKTMEPYHVRIGFATSTDLLTWTKYGSNPVIDLGSEGEWDDGSIEVGAIYKLGSTYYLYYFGIQADGGKQHIGLATSTNLIDWVKHENNPIIMTGESEEDWDWGWIAVGTNIIKIDNYYLMSYNGGDEIPGQPLDEPGLKEAGLVYSQDLIHWTKFPNNPIIRVGAAGTWDSETIFRTNLFINNDSLYVFYNAVGDSNYSATYKEQIGVRVTNINSN